MPPKTNYNLCRVLFEVQRDTALRNWARRIVNHVHTYYSCNYVCEEPRWSSVFHCAITQRVSVGVNVAQSYIPADLLQTILQQFSRWYWDTCPQAGFYMLSSAPYLTWKAFIPAHMRTRSPLVSPDI